MRAALRIVSLIEIEYLRVENEKLRAALARGPLTDPEERSVLDVALKAAKNAYENPRIIGIEVADRQATLAVLRKKLLGEHSGNAS